jgi:hypothetical protein
MPTLLVAIFRLLQRWFRQQYTLSHGALVSLANTALVFALAKIQTIAMEMKNLVARSLDGEFQFFLFGAYCAHWLTVYQSVDKSRSGCVRTLSPCAQTFFAR